MPISEDLRSVSATLSLSTCTQSPEHGALIRLACANLLALAEQVEALETVPLSVETVTASGKTQHRMPYMSTRTTLLSYAQ